MDNYRYEFDVQDNYNSCPRQRTYANARERDRTSSVNTAFTTLRSLIPTEPVDRKLSKIETLRLACSYISHLATISSEGQCNQKKHFDQFSKSQSTRPQICIFCVKSNKLHKD